MKNTLFCTISKFTNQIQKIKQVMSAIGIVSFCLIYGETSASAQLNENDIAFVANSYSQHYESPDQKNLPATYTNDINMKAKRNFTKSFENITDEKWYQIKNGYFASFKENDIKTEVYYNNRGTRLYSLLTYQEDKLASPVRALIKSKFNDYTISLAFEYKFFDGPVYIIKMKNTSTYKTVMVFDDEIRVIEEYTNT